MAAIQIHHPRKILNGVRLVAQVQSDSRSRFSHTILYIDGKFRGRRRRLFVCSCEDFLYRREGRIRSCKHTRIVRRKVGL